MAGLYIHVPFCLKKCPYCDFYSLTQLSLREKYAEAVIRSLNEWRDKTDVQCNTLYFGGGTPSVMGGELLGGIIDCAKELFLTDDAEITVECNPSSVDEKLIHTLALHGVNRISMGVQSAVENERLALGRLSGKNDVVRALETVRKHGITNVSLDLMLGVPGQTMQSLDESIDFCLQSGVPHISAYMLKIEEGTPFYETAGSLNLADEDEVCDIYMHVADRFTSAGMLHYEISNFALPGFESRHNLNYWDCGEYLGIGPAAHSFLGGKRFYYERDIASFIEGTPPVEDGTGGDFEEYVMLRLRLSEGLVNSKVKKRFGFDIPEAMVKKASAAALRNFVVCNGDGIRLNTNGFLLSNSIICEIL